MSTRFCLRLSLACARLVVFKIIYFRKPPCHKLLFKLFSNVFPALLRCLCSTNVLILLSQFLYLYRPACLVTVHLFKYVKRFPNLSFHPNEQNIYLFIFFCSCVFRNCVFWLKILTKIWNTLVYWPCLRYWKRILNLFRRTRIWFCFALTIKTNQYDYVL